MAFLTTSLIGSALKLIGGGIKGFFGYREKKLDLGVMKETNNKDLQIAWWDYLKSQKSMLVNQVIRPITMSFFIGEYIYQRFTTGVYELIVIIPKMSFGDVTIGPIYNGHILLFTVFFMFPLRDLMKWLRKE